MGAAARSFAAAAASACWPSPPAARLRWQPRAGLLGRVAAGFVRVLSGELAVALLAVARYAAVGPQPVYSRFPAMRIPNRVSTVLAEIWSAQGSDWLWAPYTAAASARLTTGAGELVPP